MPTTLVEQDRAPIKLWTDFVPPVEPQAMQQLRNLASLPFIYPHIAVMPDMHLGIGATVGSVVPTLGAICPASVGVDIGCGMDWIQTSIRADQLPDNLDGLRSSIESCIPHGRTNNGGAGDKGAWDTGDYPSYVVAAWHGLEYGYEHITKHNQKIKGAATIQQLGTMGGGNHFCEIVIDETDHVGIMVHSGSRGIGNRIGSVYIAAAKEEMLRNNVHLPDKDLAFFEEGSEIFNDYFEAVNWAQQFAKFSRNIMIRTALNVMKSYLQLPATITQEAVSCHHNYVSRERHFGSDVLVTRKGAISAFSGQLGIIPGAMGRKSFIVRGLGNPDSLCSCSHGAGRVMSRTQAKKEITLEQHAAATQGVSCRKDIDVLDESPAAYKDIDAVMASQADLVEIVHTLHAVVCVKG